ncbi:MAG: oxidoreductase [Bacteroidota bacterium]|nr:oxidoreductase [Bacteroidota bacterium]
MLNQNNPKTAVLIGSTGLIGNHLLNILLANESYSQIILISKRSANVVHPKVVEHLINFDKINQIEHLIHGDDFYCVIGTTIKKAGSKEAFRKVDYIYPLMFAQISKRNNFKKFLLVSSIGADEHSNNFYLKVKGELESQIKALNFQCSFIFRPSLLLGNRNEFRFGEKLATIIMPFFSFLLMGKLKKYKAIKAKTVANAMCLFAQKDCSGFNIIESNEMLNLDN